jgi:hypothetical protein
MTNVAKKMTQGGAPTSPAEEDAPFSKYFSVILWNHPNLVAQGKIASGEFDVYRFKGAEYFSLSHKAHVKDGHVTYNTPVLAIDGKGNPRDACDESFCWEKGSVFEEKSIKRTDCQCNIYVIKIDAPIINKEDVAKIMSVAEEVAKYDNSFISESVYEQDFYNEARDKNGIRRPLNNRCVVFIPNNASIGAYAFYRNWNIRELRIYDSLNQSQSELGEIGDGAFFECPNLQYVEIPSGISTIGEAAFRFCRFLQNVDAPDSVTNIKNNAFAGCDSLCMNIPPSVQLSAQQIRDVFKGCIDMSVVLIQRGLVPRVRHN